MEPAPRTPLPPEQWERIKRVFEEASQLPPERHAEAVEAATTDELVRREALALLAIHVEAGDFLEVPPPRAIATGDRLGPYEIVAPIGGGGMGDVYRATDTRLARTVAVKVLRDGLTSAAARARFVREARAIAAVSHSNVIAIFDVGEQAGVPYLVTELLAGETLRARLARARPALADALAWARQIAHGLAAAHDRGIVHRDLKPENIVLLDGGGLKILDFGLARSIMASPLPAGPRSDAREGVASPGSAGARSDVERRAGTIDAPHDISIPGVILGTIGYLAPEHARGQPAAASADLFALGAILYELVTGRRAFDAGTAADTLRAVLDDDPAPPSSVRPEVPAWIDRVIARCLAKDPANRFQSARDLGFALESHIDTAPLPTRRRRVAIAAIAAALSLVAGVAIGALALGGRTSVPTPPARPYAITHSGRDKHPAVSRDGRFLAFASDRDGRSRIWIQTLATGREVPITDGPDAAPRFSPEGNEVLFVRSSDGTKTLYRVDAIGGAPQKVLDLANDADWSPDGRRIAFVRSQTSEHRLVVVDIDGSNERVLARLEDRADRGRDVVQRVRWSPDGARIAISGIVGQAGSPQAISLIGLDGTATKLVTPNREGAVSAVIWEDLDTLLYLQAVSVSGNVVPGSAAHLVRHRIGSGATATLLWTMESGFVLDRWPGHGVVFDARSTRENLRAIDGSGRSVQLSNGTATDRQPVVSPDGSKVLFSSTRGTNLDIWSLDRRTGGTVRLTDHPGEDYDPAVTPDGRSLLWSSNRTGTFEIWMASLDGMSPRRITADGVNAANPTATPDGSWIVYASGSGRAGTVWKIRPDGTQAALLAGDGILPEVSPDGRYALFLSNRIPLVPTIKVVRIDDGVVVPFEIAIPIRARSVTLVGRARWMPDGSAIAFVGQDDREASGIYVQQFLPGADTSATRTKLAGFSSEREVESFDVAPDVTVLAEVEPRSQIIAVTKLP